MGSASPLPPPRSLYVHFPFCVRRCHYCDFSVTTPARVPVDEWLACIADELDGLFAASGWDRGLPLDTIYVGGGTPSLMGAEGMEALGDILRKGFRWNPDAIEWSAEANPSSLDEGLCRAWRRVGVNRLSIGVQSFDDHVLRWLGRRHDAAIAIAALAAARGAGFDTVNLDLIFGLPAEVERDWDAEVGRAASLGVPHVSAYGLTAEPRTPLGRRVGLGRVRMPGGERYESEYLRVADRLAAAGFRHYEVSNFALPGHECLHNWHYWDGGAYLGLGPSAHSFLPPRRSWNAFRWDAYRRAVREGRSPVEGAERVEGADRVLERLWLGLRTRRGLPGPELDALVGRRGRRLLDRWRGAGWLVREDGNVRATATGWLRLDEVVAALAAATETVRAGAGEGARSASGGDEGGTRARGESSVPGEDPFEESRVAQRR